MAGRASNRNSVEFAVPLERPLLDRGALCKSHANRERTSRRGAPGQNKDLEIIPALLQLYLRDDVGNGRLPGNLNDSSAAALGLLC